jgi:hypothetical protein
MASLTQNQVTFNPPENFTYFSTARTAGKAILPLLHILV